MANGYLGKISAVVSANTGDFNAKLNASAKEVQAFARTVQSNLTSASKEAARSFEGIYTPLQKFERSLQAAASMKLSFKGFAGAVKDIDVLRQRLGSMRDSQIALVLKASGMKSLTDFRDAISGLKAKDLEIVAKVGGLEKVRELRSLTADKRVDFALRLVDSGMSRQLESARAKLLELKAVAATVKAGGEAPAGGIGALAKEYREAGNEVRRLEAAARQTIKATIGVNVQKDEDVDRILRAGERAEAIRLPVVLDVLGEAAVKDAVTQTQRIRSVAEQINKPFGEAAQKLASMSIEVQAGFLPAMKRSQAQIESLKTNIEKAILPASAIAQQFDVVEKRASSAAAAVSRLEEASAKVSSMKTGAELVFDSPRLASTLDRGVDVGNRAAALPASTIEANPRIAEMLREISSLSNKAVAAYAGLQRRVALGLPTESAQKGADALQDKLELLFAEFDKVYKLHVDTAEADKKATELKSRLDSLRTEVTFAVTGGFSNADQVVSEVSRITADIQKLDATQKAAFGKRAALVIDLLGDNKIQDAAIEVKNLRSDLDQEMELKVTTAAAQKAVDDFEKKMIAVREQNAFVITGRPQTMEQAESQEARLRGEVGELKGSQRRAFKGLLEDAAVARESGDLVKYRDALDAIDQKLASVRRFNVKTAEAKKNLDDLKATMDSLMAESNFVITAKVQDSKQAESEIKRIIGAMEQLDASQRTALRPKVNAAIASLGAKDATTGLPDIAVISAAVKDLDDEFNKERVIKVNKDKAQKDVESLRDALGSIADKIGDPSQPIDRLRQAVEKANAAIAKMPAGAIKTKLESDLNAEKVRIEAMSQPSSPPPSPAGIDAAAARVDAIAAGATAATPAKATANPLGADFGTAERRIATLQGTVQSLQGSLEKLPLPMQAQFIPAINKVRAAFQGLNTSSTQKEIDAATKKAAGLERALTRAGQASKIGQTLGESLNAAALGKVEKQIGFIRSKLLEVGAAASGPVADAFNKYAAAAANAAKSGTAGLPAVQKQLDGLINKLVKAAVAAGTLDAKQAKAFKKSVGDVGRGGVDNLALGLNQAIFAIDDFMSSTGGLEFKLRAVSNNITQLGFIVGGTAGLFVGLSAVIAGQAAVGLIKWMNDGRSAEDQTKAFNESLARQKSLVEDLAQAFKSLGDAMTRGTFSAGGEQAAEFDRQMEDIKKKQRESREGRVADLDENVQKERANQVKLKSDLEKSSDPAERISLQRRIEASAAREQDAVQAAVRRTANPGEARERFRAARERVGFAEIDNRGNDLRTIEARVQEVRERAAREAEAIPVGDSIEDITAQRNALEKELNRLSEKAKNAGRFFFTDDGADAAKESLKPLEETLKRLDLQLLEKKIDKAANDIAEASRGPAAQIRRAQEDVADAIRRGVPNAAAFQRELDANAKKLRDAYSALEDAQKETDPTKKQAKVDEAKKNIAEVEAERDNVERRSQEVRLGRTFGGDRTTAALSSLQGNDRFKSESARTNSYLEVSIDRELEARRQLEAATAKGVEAEIKAAEASLEAAQKASEAAAAFAEAAIAIEAALTRIRKVGESALQKSEQGADAAQKAFEENPLRGGGFGAREDAERRLIDDKARVASAQDDLDNQRRAIQFDPQMEKINGELEAITQRRKDLEAKNRTDKFDPAEQVELDAARKREIELMRQREHLARDLTEAEREQLDTINNGIAAREKELEKSRQRAAEDPTFKRRMDATNQLIADSERQANEAQQRFINNPTEKNRKERDEADARLRADRLRAQELQDNLDNKRKEIEQDPAVAANNRAIAANDKRLAELAGKEASVGLTQAERDERTALQEGNRELRAENEAAIAAGTKPEQKAIDDAQRDLLQRDRARRGRDLAMTEQERFRRDVEEGMGADIRARAKELEDQGVDPSDFINKAIEEQGKLVAPMLQQFAEERQNGIMQGNRRAKMEVTDITTSQGQAELNRLLRGDDASKDVNLEELRKQNEKLDTLIDVVKNNPLPVI